MLHPKKARTKEHAKCTFFTICCGMRQLIHEEDEITVSSCMLWTFAVRTVWAVRVPRMGSIQYNATQHATACSIFI